MQKDFIKHELYIISKKQNITTTYHYDTLCLIGNRHLPFDTSRPFATGVINGTLGTDFYVTQGKISPNDATNPMVKQRYFRVSATYFHLSKI